MPGARFVLARELQDDGARGLQRALKRLRGGLAREETSTIGRERGLDLGHVPLVGLRVVDGFDEGDDVRRHGLTQSLKCHEGISPRGVILSRATILLVAAILCTPIAALAVPNGNAIHRLAHDVEVEPGVTLHVVEVWSDASEARANRLAVLMVPPTLVTHKVFDADVPDDPSYSGLYQAAQRGYYAYSFDHWGYGGSSHPANGMDVTFERMLPQTGALVEFARERSGAAKVDLVSGSLGNSIAFALGGAESPIDATHVGSIVMTSNVYAQASLVLSLTVLSPAACDLQPPPPEGYTDSPPPLYAIILWNAELAAQLWAYQTFPGHYAQGPTQEGCDLPVYPASMGRAPALVVYGDHDLLTDASDVAQFASEYGGPVEVKFMPGGGHAPYFESVRHEFWDAAFAWFDAHRA